MTCHEARELFSAVVDDALDAGERSALDAHLVGCADCRRELDGFRRTVALVQALPPERAPAGLVDRVVARARPAPWPARLVRGLFVPWATKLPLEAAAILLVGGLAVWVFQRTPEQQQSARLEQAPPRAEAPAPLERIAPPEDAPKATAPTPVPAAPPDSTRIEKKETQQTPAEVPAGGSEVQPPRVAQESREEPSPENRVARDALEKRTPASPSPARSAARALSAPGPADVSGRLTMDDPRGGATALEDVVRRFGGSVAASRADGDAHLVELTVPRDRYPDFAREVARLGRWQAEADAASLPETVRVRIRLTR